MRLRKYMTDSPTVSLILARVSGVSDPIFEKRSTIFIRWVRSLFISSTAVGSTAWLRRYSIHPSSDEVGVPSWWAVSFASPIQTRFCSSRFVERKAMKPSRMNIVMTQI